MVKRCRETIRAQNLACSVFIAEPLSEKGDSRPDVP